MAKIDYRYEDKLIQRSSFHYILPAMIGLLFGQLSPIVGGISISRTLGETAFSALSTIEPINLVFSAVGALVGVGCGITASKCSGSGDKEIVGRIFTRTMILLGAVSLFLAVTTGLFADPILRFLRATPENLSYAREYLLALLVGSPFIVFMFALDYIITDDNNPMLVLVGSVAAAAINAILNVVLVDVLHWGIWASAFAMVFGDFVACLIFLSHFKKKDSLCRIVDPHKREGDPSLLSTLKPGTPMGIMYMMFAIQMVVQNIVLEGESGTSGLGNSAVVDNLVLFLTIFTASASEPVMPLASSYFGEGNKCGLLLVKRKMYHLGIYLLAPVVLVLVAFPQLFMALFSVQDPVMLKTLPFAIRIVCLNALLTFTNDSLVNFLSATEREHLANISYGIQIVLNIGTTLLLARTVPMDAPWYGAMVANASSCLFLLMVGKLTRGFIKRYSENALVLTGGDEHEPYLDEWKREAADVLTSEQCGLVWDKVISAYVADIPEGKSPLCSFTVLERENGDKAAIVRYMQKTKLFAAETAEEADEDELSHVYGECIRSEFNTLRRLMINFECAKE